MAQTDSSKKTSIFLRVLEIFLRPRAAFAALSEDSQNGWRIPMLALTLSATLVVLVGGFLKARAAAMGETPLPPDWQWWTPDMQNNYMQAQQSMQGPVFNYVIPLMGALIALWVGWLILGATLHFGSTLFGGRGSMQGALNVAAWASLPFFLQDLLKIVYMLIARHPIQSAGLSGFASNSAFLAQLLSRLDLFFIWSVILLIVGFRVVENMPLKKIRRQRADCLFAAASRWRWHWNFASQPKRTRHSAPLLLIFA